jgi:pimeloyl-ACP methyl ester carboxylesterase
VESAPRAYRLKAGNADLPISTASGTSPWGSALGFDWANRHRDAVKGIAFMEAIVRPQGWDHWDKINMRPALQGLRSAAGKDMVLRDNFFIARHKGRR